jgi:hypothetical protein
VNGAVLGWVDLQTLHSLASSENIEQVSCQLLVGTSSDSELELQSPQGFEVLILPSWLSG